MPLHHHWVEESGITGRIIEFHAVGNYAMPDAALLNNTMSAAIAAAPETPLHLMFDATEQTRIGFSATDLFKGNLVEFSKAPNMGVMVAYGLTPAVKQFGEVIASVIRNVSKRSVHVVRTREDALALIRKG